MVVIHIVKLPFGSARCAATGNIPVCNENNDGSLRHRSARHSVDTVTRYGNSVSLKLSVATDRLIKIH